MNHLEVSVAPTGNSANTGTEPRPFMTLVQARNVFPVRREAEENEPRQQVSVTVRGGTCRLGEPFWLGPQDNGSRYCPVTWASAPGEKVVLSGAVAITGWEKWRDRIRRVPLAEHECQALVWPPGAFPQKWANTRDAKANIYGGWGWSNTIIPAISIEHESQERMLYYLPPDDIFDDTTICVPAVDCLVRMRDTAWITLQGFTLTCSTTGDDYHRKRTAIVFHGGKHNMAENNIFISCHNIAVFDNPKARILRFIASRAETGRYLDSSIGQTDGNLYFQKSGVPYVCALVVGSAAAKGATP